MNPLIVYDELPPFAIMNDRDSFAVSFKVPKVFKIPYQLPGPDPQFNNDHTLSLYKRMYVEGPFSVNPALSIESVMLMNNDLDCVVLFTADVININPRDPHCIYFLGSIDLATGTWRWCIPIFSKSDLDDCIGRNSVTMLASNTNPNTVVVSFYGRKHSYLRGERPYSCTILWQFFEDCIRAEEFNVLTGNSVTRTRMPFTMNPSLYEPRITMDPFAIKTDHQSVFTVTSIPPKHFTIPYKLPAPDPVVNSDHTSALYKMLKIEGPFAVYLMKFKSVLLTNNGLDCIVIFTGKLERKVERNFNIEPCFIGSIVLATGQWRWCIPTDFPLDWYTSSNEVNLRASNTHPNRAMVSFLNNSCIKTECPITRGEISGDNGKIRRICAEEFDVLTGTSITRLTKSRLPYIRLFEFLSDPVVEPVEEARKVPMPDMVYHFLGNEDWMRELLTY